MRIDPSTSEESAQPSEKPVILVADDSRVIRLALKKILQKEFVFIESNDGEEAWAALLDDSTIQVVFSDLSMPELDGFGLLDRIRSSTDERISNLPFIVITGNEDDEGILQRALDCGATDLITKPFQSKEIKERAYAFAKHHLVSKASVDESVPAELTDWSQDSKQDIPESEDVRAIHKKEEDFRKNAAEEATARIKEEVEERRKKFEKEDTAAINLKKQEEEAQAKITEEALRKIEVAEKIEASREKAAEISARINAEIEARKKAEEALARFKQEIEDRKVAKNAGKPHELEIEFDEAEVDKDTHQNVDQVLGKEKEEQESVIAFDVQQTNNVIQQNAHTANKSDSRSSKEETEMIREQLRRRLQAESTHEQHQYTSGSFFIRIIVSVLTVINFLPGIKLDETIKNIKDRFET